MATELTSNPYTYVEENRQDPDFELDGTESIVAFGQTTFSDFRRGYRIASPRPWNLYFMLGVSLIAAYQFLSVINFDVDFFALLQRGIVPQAIGFFVGIIAIQWFISHRHLRALHAKWNQTQLTFTDRGVCSETDGIRTECAWNQYSRCVRRGECVALCRNGSIEVVTPSRFSDAADWAIFLEMLNLKFGLR